MIKKAEKFNLKLDRIDSTEEEKEKSGQLQLQST